MNYRGLFQRLVKEEKGDIIGTSLIIIMILIFVVFPIASVVIEKNIALIKGQEIKDSMDITNVAVYNALNVQSTSMANIDFKSADALAIYRRILAENLRLNSDLTPTASSIAENTVVINELNFYTSGFPLTCSKGKTITRPTIHATITVPIRPSLYRAVILSMIGKQYVDLEVHVDTNLPINK